MNKHETLKWLQGRQSGVGSSDSPILALPPEKVFKKSPVELYVEKKKTIKLEHIEGQQDDPHLRRGHTYEPLAAALYEAQSGIKVHAPITDKERFHTYQVWDASSPLFADFDGFCEDGWVLEIKSPMQRVCDNFRTQGVRDYYLVQCMHLAHLANVCELPFLGADSMKWLGKIKGTRLVVYEPENVQLQIIPLPIDHDMIKIIVDNAKSFWKNHVLPSVPPQREIYSQPIKPKDAPKAKYTQVEGSDWADALNLFKLAKEQELVAKVKVDGAKLAIIKQMKKQGLEAAQIGFHKFLNRLVAGSTRFDRALLQADYPDMDLQKYMVQGKPRMQFNHYGPKPEVSDTSPDGSMEKEVVTIQVELQRFLDRKMDPQEGIEEFDDLRGRADMYAAMLEMELGAIREGIESAAQKTASAISAVAK